MNDYHISVFYSDEDQGWIAEIPDLPGCSAYGDTPEQAVTEVGIAKVAWLEIAQAQGRSHPETRRRLPADRQTKSNRRTGDQPINRYPAQPLQSAIRSAEL